MRLPLDDSTLGVGQSRGDGIRRGVEETGLQTLHVLVSDAACRHEGGLRDTGQPGGWRESVAEAGRVVGEGGGEDSQTGRAEVDDADTTITTTTTTLQSLVFADRTVADAERAGDITITGDRDAAEHLLCPS